jgi:hypothetical protein
MIDSDLEREKEMNIACQHQNITTLTSVSSKKNSRDGRLLKDVTTDSGVD